MNEHTYGHISLQHSFDAGHRIVAHKGKCARLHGHTYHVNIEVWGEVRDPGFVVDFGDLKDLVNEWDHKLLLWDEDPFFQELGGVIPDVMDIYGIENVPFNPTAENMAQDLADRIFARFNCRCTVQLWETPKSFAEASS